MVYRQTISVFATLTTRRHATTIGIQTWRRTTRTPKPYGKKTLVEKWRTALAAADDGSVEIITIGFLNSIYEVLISPADGISSMTGLELVTAKVSKMWSMGGDWATGL